MKKTAFTLAFALAATLPLAAGPSRQSHPGTIGRNVPGSASRQTGARAGSEAVGRSYGTANRAAGAAVGTATGPAAIGGSAVTGSAGSAGMGSTGSSIGGAMGSANRSVTGAVGRTESSVSHGTMGTGSANRTMPRTPHR